MRFAQIAIAGLCLSTVASALKVNQHTGLSKNGVVPDIQLAQAGKSSITNSITSGITGKSTTTKKKNDDPYGFGEFIAGCIMIPFALVFLWKNEKKIVTFQKCMDRAEKEVKTVKADEASSDNNFKLIHVTGKTENKTDLIDNDFAVTAENSYRLKRVVEVYQWQEHSRKEEDSDRVIYSYTQGWSQHPIDSGSFHESGHDNPSTNWPFRSHTIEAQNVTLGAFRLNASQISRLGSSNRRTFAPSDDQVNQTAGAMQQCGYSPCEVRGNYLFSSSKDNSQVGEHIGQMRISIEYEECGNTTVIAQQMQDNEEVFTFRKWNPDKVNVEWGVSTDAEGDTSCGNPLCCYICMCVNCCFNVMFEEVVDHAVDRVQQTASYFDGQKDTVNTAGKFFRPLGIVICIIGFYSLFAPIIALLKWIPLVGWLLGGIVAIAAAIFAIIVGGTLSILVIAIAWVFFRPMIGIPLLLIVATSIYFIFYYDWSKVQPITDDAAATTGGTTGGDVTPKTT